MKVPGYPNMTEAEYFAPWRYAGQRPFNPAIDGMDARTAAALGALYGLAGALFLALLFVAAH